MPLSKMKTQTWGQQTPLSPPIASNPALTPWQKRRLKDRKDGTWESKRKEALADYKTNRENGRAADNPSRPFPHDGADTFEKGRGNDKNGEARNPEWWYVTYTEGPGDKKWMEEKDRNYLARINGKGEASTPKPIERKNTPPEIRRMRQEMEALKRSQKAEREKRQKLERERAQAEKQRQIELEKLRAEKAASEEARKALEEKLLVSGGSFGSSGSSHDRAGPSTPISDSGEVTLSFNIDANDIQRHEDLGEGSYSVVYRATYRFQDVAVKELKSVNLSEKALYELKNEVNIMARLHSKHIVHFHGACFQKPYRIVMEYMPKGSLYNVLKSNEPLSWHQRYRIGLDMAIGLHQMHALKPPILHRDLKSLNVLLDKDYRAKLTDFGLSKIKTETASTTRHTGSVGSLPWMASELFKRRPKYSPASDVYALGMVLWELASRKLPFSDVADPSLIRGFVLDDDEPEEFPNDCPMVYGKIIQQCWSKKPEERPTAKVVAESLTKLFNASPQPSRQPGNTAYIHSENPAEESVMSFGSSS